MIKAIFLDYTGTILTEGGTEIQEVLTRICKNSSLHDPKLLLKEWWALIKAYEEESYQDSYLTEDEIADKALNHLVQRLWIGRLR